MNKNRNQVAFNRKLRKLESYLELKYEVDTKHDELIELAEKIDDLTGVQGIRYSNMPKGGKPVLFTDIVDDLADKERILQNSFNRANRRKEEIEKAIDNIEDSELRVILKMKYINDYSFSKIGQLTRNHKMTAWNKCNKAIEILDI